LTSCSDPAPAIKIRPPPAFSRQLRTVGVTGTNGKTSTTALVAAALARLQAPVARVTTVGNFLDHEQLDVPLDREGFLTTMRRAVDAGGTLAAIELSSEALALGFAKFWPCAVAVFTNLSRDHLDAHGSAEHYLASKAQLFMQLPAGGSAVLNGCDPASALLAEVIPAGVDVLRYGLGSRGAAVAPLDLEGGAVDVSWTGSTALLQGSDKLGLGALRQLRVRAIGEVFVENALAALAAACCLGLAPEQAAEAIAAAPPPPGRFEMVSEQPRVVVDYAHSPDALRRCLQTARGLCAGRLTVVFGAGGGRDRAKRPQMGEAATVADHVVLTSDNPRGEDPADIAAAICEGITQEHDVQVSTVLDRADAIGQALADCAPDDVVVIAGKGHETEQERAGQRRAMSDAALIAETLAR